MSQINSENLTPRRKKDEEKLRKAGEIGSTRSFQIGF